MNDSGWAIASSQSEQLKLDLPSYLKQLQTEQNIWNNGFQDKGYHAMQDRYPHKKSCKRGEPCDCPATILKESLGSGAQKGNWQCLLNSPGWRDETEQTDIGRSCRDRVPERRELNKEQTWGSTEGLPWVFSRVLIDKYMWGKHQRSGKEHQKGSVGTAPVTQSWKWWLFPPAYVCQGTGETTEKSWSQ